jgi:hypothetical protein
LETAKGRQITHRFDPEDMEIGDSGTLNGRLEIECSFDLRGLFAGISIDVPVT